MQLAQLSGSGLGRSREYLEALEHLKTSFVKSIDIGQKLHDLGLKYGLSAQEIRKDIESALEGIVKPRQLRSLLPLELKQKQNHTHASKKVAANKKIFDL
jgi:hypothetical protein